MMRHLPAIAYGSTADLGLLAESVAALTLGVRGAARFGRLIGWPCPRQLLPSCGNRALGPAVRLAPVARRADLELLPTAAAENESMRLH